jgi:hypothetical protein
VTSPAEICKGLPSQISLLDGDRFDQDTGSAKEDLTLLLRARTELALHNEREFDKVGDADPAGLAAWMILV